MKNPFKFAVIGGDMRQVKLSNLLVADGHPVTAFAIDQVRPEGATLAATLQSATAGADCVLLPLPLTRERTKLNAPLSDTGLSIEQVFCALEPGQIITGGRVEAATHQLAAEYGLSLIDYYAREELVVANAVATVEGAIQTAMQATPTTLAGSRVLIFGFGRIGKVLSHRLRGLGAFVTAVARTYADLAWIAAYGYRGIHLDAIDGALGGQDILFNTVPQLILDAGRLAMLDRDTLCIDLASKPGGIDFPAAASLGVKTIWALGLPGEVAPVSAAMIIRDTIYHILSEQGKDL
ncbi:MAG: dipicolinate synthase subunit DpsA [Oscillospiraceae bacterium]|nr:dipicolinate synthase subunit DpsA [Oscillospiraceae bacterium]